MDCRVLNLNQREFFIKPIVLGLVSLLWFSSSNPSKPFRLALGFAHSLTHSPIYHLLVLFFIFLLGYKVWRLCGDIGDIRKSYANLRSGCCSKCGVNGEFNHIGKKEDEGDKKDEVLKLKEEIEKERKLRGFIELELEKERRAAASAIEETMAKILCLQHEKGLVEREFRQYRQMAEQKKAYDGEIVENLKWMVMQFKESSISDGYN